MSNKPTYEELEQRIKKLEKDSVMRKQVEKDLRESEHKLNTHLQNTPIAAIAWDLNFRIIEWNPAAEYVFGYSSEEAMGKHPNELILPEELIDVVDGIFRDLISEKGGVRSTNENITKDGRRIICDWYNTTLKGADGKVIGVASLVHDITYRKQAEESLRASEEKFSRVFHCSAAIVGISDLETGEYVEVNQAFCDYLGFTPEEVIGKKSSEVVHMDMIFRNSVIAKMKRQGYIKNEETIIYNKKGTPINVLFSAQIIEIADKKYNYATAIDITELKRTQEAKLELQERLNRSRKMEALGLLAGGVAHDLNNILSGIVSYPELILMDLPEDSKLRNPIETIQKSGCRAAAIVNDLLTVAKGVATPKEPLNLNDTIRDYLDSPEFKSLEQLNPTVTINTKLDTGILSITGSQIHLRKIMMNIVSNAMDAIEGSGNITISTVNKYVDRPLQRYDDINVGEYAVLAVSDDGSGLLSGDLKRIFEPFYTKKVMGRSGTGLGLAVVWNAVQDHDGYIDVKNDENGVTFQLYFPITGDRISDKNLSVPITNYKGSGEKILVVDDEDSQREITCKMLDVLDYKNFSVSGGEKAVEYLNEHSVDLLLLDMIMDPGINGRETYERAIKIYPKQKAIIVSGFAETDEVQKAQELGAGTYIKKPLTLEKLGIAVKEELGK